MVGAIGMIAALTAVGAGLGIVLAGPIVSVLGYHWLFWFPLIAVVLVGSPRRSWSPNPVFALSGRSTGSPHCCFRGGWSRCCSG